MKGDLTILTLRAVLEGYYNSEDGYTHCSIVEMNEKFGFAKKNLPKLFKILVDEKYIEDCTVNGYYKRLKILKHYRCPNFILDNQLNNQQKQFLLKCQDENITRDMSKKEICRALNLTENVGNLNRTLEKIKTKTNKDIFEILESAYNVTNLIPKNAIYTEYGYRTSSTIKKGYLDNNSEINIIANNLYKKTLASFRTRPNIKNYDLDAQFIKDLLLNQNMKDYYTGKIPKYSSDYSVDRVNSSKGYTRDNIVITTTNINTMKMDMSLDTFKYNIEILYNHLIKNQD